MDSCGERNEELCTTENNTKTCTKCCSDRICNGDRIKEHRIQYIRQEAMELGEARTELSRNFITVEIIWYHFQYIPHLWVGNVFLVSQAHGVLVWAITFEFPPPTTLFSGMVVHLDHI